MAKAYLQPVEIEKLEEVAQSLRDRLLNLIEKRLLVKNPEVITTFLPLSFQ